MVTTIISFIPCITCLFWIVLYPLIARQSKSFRQMELFLLATGISTLAGAFVLNGLGGTGSANRVFFLIGQFTTPMVIPLSQMYLRCSESSNKKNYFSVALIAIPFSLLFAETILLLLSGPDSFSDFINKLIAGTSYSALNDQVEQLIYLCSVWIFGAIMAIETIWLIVKTVTSIIKHELFLQSISILILLFLYITTLSIVGVSGWKQNAFVTIIEILTALFIFIISYTGLFEKQESVTFRTLIDGLEFYNEENDIQENFLSENPGEENAPHQDLIEKLHQTTSFSKTTDYYMDDDVPELDEDETEEGDSSTPLPQDFEDSLRIRFEDAVISEQMFLQKGLKISDIATKLNTNRTYISRLVNNTYNMSFSDYINTLRIDYAEQYLIHNKGAKQTDIATACGFPNASSFNNIFKKITGVTPKIWLATRS